MNSARKVSQQGFSLLEAVVALVILASSGWALFSWVNASIVSLRRVEDANARSAATSNAVEYMQTVNPMLRPEGAAELGGYRIQWASSLSTPVMSGSNLRRSASPYDLALYDTVVRAFLSDGDQPWFEFKLKLVGYKQVRSVVNPFLAK
jgi:general secretion pathway protein I